MPCKKSHFSLDINAPALNMHMSFSTLWRGGKISEPMICHWQRSQSPGFANPYHQPVACFSVDDRLSGTIYLRPLL